MRRSCPSAHRLSNRPETKRTVVPGIFQIVGHQQNRACTGDEGEKAGDQVDAEQAVAEQLQVDHRLRCPDFKGQKAGQENDEGGEQGNDRCLGEACGLPNAGALQIKGRIVLAGNDLCHR